MTIMSRDEVIKSIMADIKEYQKKEGLTDLQCKMDVMAALNPWMFRETFGNDPEEWKRLRGE